MARISIYTNNDKNSKSYRDLTLRELESKVSQLEKEANRVNKDPNSRNRVLQSVKNTKIEIEKRLK